MTVVARLGNLQLTDESPLQAKSPDFKHLLSIEGDEFAELRYESFSPAQSLQKGINSYVNLTTGSLKLRFREAPLNRIYLFLLKFARLKGLYDAAASVAVQQAAKVERMGFRLNVRSPILIFPVDPSRLEDVFTLKLGELDAHNEYEGSTQFVMGSLSGIQLASLFYIADKAELRIIDDVNISTEVAQSQLSGVQPQVEIPEFKVRSLKLQSSPTKLLT